MLEQPCRIGVKGRDVESANRSRCPRPDAPPDLGNPAPGEPEDRDGPGAHAGLGEQVSCPPDQELGLAGTGSADYELRTVDSCDRLRPIPRVDGYDTHDAAIVSG